MNNIGTLQRRWSATEPKVYDKETRMVCLDIRPEKGSVGGNVQASDSVRCGDVQGNVRASDSVHCSTVVGDVNADSVRFTKDGKGFSFTTR